MEPPGGELRPGQEPGQGPRPRKELRAEMGPGHRATPAGFSLCGGSHQAGSEGEGKNHVYVQGLVKAESPKSHPTGRAGISGRELRPKVVGEGTAMTLLRPSAGV